jgi:hypothetical protein
MIGTNKYQSPSNSSIVISFLEACRSTQAIYQIANASHFFLKTAELDIYQLLILTKLVVSMLNFFKTSKSA